MYKNITFRKITIKKQRLNQVFFLNQKNRIYFFISFCALLKKEKFTEPSQKPSIFGSFCGRKIEKVLKSRSFSILDKGFLLC